MYQSSFLFISLFVIFIIINVLVLIIFYFSSTTLMSTHQFYTEAMWCLVAGWG